MKLAKKDQAVMDGLRLTRLALPESIQRFTGLEDDSPNAIQKRVKRLAEKGFLATSLLPSGKQCIRLSNHGCKHTGSPLSWSEAPTPGSIAEALALGTLIGKEDFDILSPTQVAQYLKSTTRDRLLTIPARVVSSRFVLTNEQNGEMRFNFLLAEIRPAARLTERAVTVVNKLSAIPFFRSLIDSHLFGLLVAVPTDGVRTTLEQQKFPHSESVRMRVIVVDNFHHLASL